MYSKRLRCLVDLLLALLGRPYVVTGGHKMLVMFFFFSTPIGSLGQSPRKFAT